MSKPNAHERFNPDVLGARQRKAIEGVLTRRRKRRLRALISAAIARGFPIKHLPDEVIIQPRQAIPRAASPYEHLFGIWHGALEIIGADDSIV